MNAKEKVQSWTNYQLKHEVWRLFLKRRKELKEFIGRTRFLEMLLLNQAKGRPIPEPDALPPVSYLGIDENEFNKRYLAKDLPRQILEEIYFALDSARFNVRLADNFAHAVQMASSLNSPSISTDSHPKVDPKPTKAERVTLYYSPTIDRDL